MENAGPSLSLHHVDRDDSSATISVEGQAPAGKAACLMPRRYRKRPDWFVVELVELDAPTNAPQEFRLTCSSEGLWGTEGIEILASDSSIRITREEAAAAAEPAPTASGSAMSSRLKAARKVTDSQARPTAKG